ncbi:MAG: hypothetical protein ACRDTA_09815 [Pseudonocardiaceae bacterium]
MAILPQYVATTMTTTGERSSSTSPLFFELNTDPDPVRVSPPTGNPQRADFVLIGSRRSTQPIECSEITVTIPTGNNSPDLTPDINSISPQISLPNWSAQTHASTRNITFTPTTGIAVIGRDQGVTIQLMGMRINTVVGSAPLRITITWRESFIGNETEPWETGTTIFDIGKFPASFQLDNFKAEQPIVDNGDSVKLNWEASGASSLRLLYDAAEINVLTKSTYTVHNLSHTTVFYLRGTVQAGTNSVTRTLTTTITVRNQDLEVGNLRVVRNLRVLGNLRVHRDLLMATNTPGTPITVRFNPAGIAITPDGKTAYITHPSGGSVTPIRIWSAVMFPPGH